MTALKWLTAPNAFVCEIIGSVLKGLKGQGLYENTIVVNFSDYGEMIGNHCLFCHQIFKEYSKVQKADLLLGTPNSMRTLLKLMG